VIVDGQPVQSAAAPSPASPAHRPNAPPNASSSSAQVAPPPIVPRPGGGPPPLPKRAANRRTLVEGVSMPDASEMTSAPSDGLEWWVSRDGTPVGPLTTEQVREGLTHGAIDVQTQVCRADRQEWRPAVTFVELTSAAPTSKSKPPPRR
jgi:hypothetical protein